MPDRHVADLPDALAPRPPQARSTPIRVPKTAEVVADQIRRRIIRGELQEGNFLPLESQVMQELGVSRPTLREALRILEAESLISVMRGSRSGARVHRPRVEAASRYAGFVLQAQGTTIADIYEARLAIEPHVVRKLAEEQTPGGVQRLRVEIDRLQNLVDSSRDIHFMVALTDFHKVLVELSGMRTLYFVTRMLQEILARYQVVYMQTSFIPEATHRRNALAGISSFRRLVDLIEAGDAAKAEAHWRLHLVNANRAWVPPGAQTKAVDIFE